MKSTDDEDKLYMDCIEKQLDEFTMLSSIYCNHGEIMILDAGAISEFHEYLQKKSTSHPPQTKLEYTITIPTENNDKIEVRIGLPHLYPILENANVTIRTTLVTKTKEAFIKNEIDKFISTMDKSDGYIYQVITWIQDRLEEFLQKPTDSVQDLGKTKCSIERNLVDFERLWIYSHHIKSKTKRQDIIRNANDLDLSGFSRPGKPGIICVEGLKKNTQEFWKLIKLMHWQKIGVRKSEVKQKCLSDIDNCRRFTGFREEIMTDIGVDSDSAPMNMSLFMKYLDDHKSGYIKKDLFGFD